MQCELSGAAESKHVVALGDLLTGLSGHSRDSIKQRELTIKSQVSPFTELKLVQQIADAEAASPDRYRPQLLSRQSRSLLTTRLSHSSMYAHAAGRYVTMAYL